MANKMEPEKGEVLDRNLVGANKGDVWTGFEWVHPARYEELRTSGLMTPEGLPLPPLYPGLLPACDKTAEACKMRFDGTAATPYTNKLYDALETMLWELDPQADREGLVETPARAAKAWMDWTSGYRVDPASVLKTFEDGAEGCDEMVVVRDIPVYSHCEHHLAPIFGTATVAYLPDKRIVGLSKLPRLVEVFMRRLQVQERMTNQIASAIMEHLQPKGCGVVIRARHMCMESRGVRLAGTETVTSAMRGMFRDDAQVRAEFLSLAHGG